MQRPVAEIDITFPNLFLLVGSGQSFRGLVLIFCLSRSNLFALTPFGYVEFKYHTGRVLYPTILFFMTSFCMKIEYMVGSEICAFVQVVREACITVAFLSQQLKHKVCMTPKHFVLHEGLWSFFSYLCWLGAYLDPDGIRR
jgi:hypothetical protein